MKITINVVYPAFALASFAPSPQARAVDPPPFKSTIFLKPRVLIGFAVYATGLFLSVAPMSGVAAEDNAAAELSPSVPEQAPGRWKVTCDLVTARELHTATLLPNGQVLVAGGWDLIRSPLASAELY